METALGKRSGGGEEGDAAGFIFEFHSPDFHVPHDVQDWLHDKLRVRLEKYEQSIERVRVFVRDQNGSKGGEDKMIRMHCTLNGLEPLDVVETNHDLRAAMDLCLDRLELALGHHLDKRIAKQLEKGRKMVRNKKLASS